MVYGLGNFIFNSDGQYGEADVPPLSLLGRLRLADIPGGIEKSLLLYPIVSNNQATQFRPRFVAANEFAGTPEAIPKTAARICGAAIRITTGRDRDGWCRSRLVLSSEAR